jgi:hypothetical protein
MPGSKLEVRGIMLRIRWQRTVVGVIRGQPEIGLFEIGLPDVVHCFPARGEASRLGLENSFRFGIVGLYRKNASQSACERTFYPAEWHCGWDILANPLAAS